MILSHTASSKHGHKDLRTVSPRSAEIASDNSPTIHLTVSELHGDSTSMRFAWRTSTDEVRQFLVFLYPEVAGLVPSWVAGVARE
jgi:hypothetical protein